MVVPVKVKLAILVALKYKIAVENNCCVKNMKSLFVALGCLLFTMNASGEPIISMAVGSYFGECIGY